MKLVAEVVLVDPESAVPAKMHYDHGCRQGITAAGIGGGAGGCLFVPADPDKEGNINVVDAKSILGAKAMRFYR